MTSPTTLAELRNLGWSVAVHNDYRISGQDCTFWLLTHACGRWVKGEGHTDEEALADCLRRIERFSMNNRPPQPYAIRCTDNNLTLTFDTYEQAIAHWAWWDRVQDYPALRDAPTTEKIDD